jgi:hypothetical protein
MAARFDAASDRATYSGGSGAPPTPSAGWAASWWAYISVDQNTFATMLRLFAGGTVLNLAMGSTGTAPGAFTGGGTVEIDTQCSVGAWYYLGYTVSGSTVTVYVFDATGALFDSATGTIGGGTPTGLCVGGRDASDPDEWFNGRLRAMRIWSTTRTQAEFAAEQFSTDPVITANLWEHYPLTGAGDLTGVVGGHNLTAGSTATTTEDDPPFSTAITGSGAATAPASVAAGIGTTVVAGAGAATAGAAIAAGAGGVVVAGSGTAVAPAALSAGTGTSDVAGQGSAVAPAAVVAGGGQVLIAGSGVVVAPAAEASGAGGEPADDRDVTLTASLAPQGRITSSLGARRWTATLEAQP